jgi:hypothetical protein
LKCERRLLSGRRFAFALGGGPLARLSERLGPDRLCVGRLNSNHAFESGHWHAQQFANPDGRDLTRSGGLIGAVFAL